jgi:hypothetical protein
MFNFDRTAEGLKNYIAAMDQHGGPITGREQAIRIMSNYFKYGDSGWTMHKFAVEADNQSIDMISFLEDALNENQTDAQ